MPTTAKANRTTPAQRALLEWSASAPAGSPLRVDRGAGVIYGVKVLGFHSRNNHGLKEATGGTEYTRRCMEESLPLYEGVDVLVSHRAKLPAAGREDDAFGQLRNATLAADGIRADLHYLKSHAMAERVLEDVERGLGVFGLSHDASAKRERFDRASKRLVIESLATVRSVDLVRKPATNRNLWESTVPQTTRRALIEALALAPARKKAVRALLEDDLMAPTLDAPMDAPGGDAATDPDEAIDEAFKTAMHAQVDALLEDSHTLAEFMSKCRELYKSRAKIMGGDAPADDAPAAGAGSDADKTEAVKKLEHKLAVRELCEELSVKADKTLLESLEDLPLDKARKLVERERARPSGAPKAGGAHGGGKPAKKASGKSFLDAITE